MANINWISLGAPSGGISTFLPTVGVNADGRLEAFLIGTDGLLWHIWQLTPNAGWGAWTSLDAPSNVTGDVNYPAVGRNADGRLEVFVVGTDNALWHTWQLSPGGAWY
jgi:hypothetical protein